MPSALPSVLSITPPTAPAAAEPIMVSALSAPTKRWPLSCAPPAIEFLTWAEVAPAAFTVRPEAFKLPSMVTLTAPPNWLLPDMLRSISPTPMLLALPLRSRAR
jgi:hypothetical protein